MRNKVYKSASLTSLLVFLLLAFNSNGQLIVNNSTTAEQMVANILGPGVTATNIVLNCDDVGSGTFMNGSTTNIGINEGVLLTSGDISDAPGPNLNEGTSYNSSEPGDADLDGLISPILTNDACVLEFDFIATGDQITVQYVFASEEYNEYVCSNFNDVFAFFVSGNNPAGGAYTNENVALVPGDAEPVAINNVNIGAPGSFGDSTNCGSLDNTAFFIDNSAIDSTSTIEYDGFTASLFATVNIIPGETYHFKFAIADAGDSNFDSGVFLKAESFSIFTCDAGTVSIEGSAEICTDDDIEDIVEVSTTSILPDDTYVYLLTNGSGEILAVQSSNLINMEPYPNGTYLIYGVSHDDGGPSGLVVGGNIANISNPNGCIEISNPVTILLTNCFGGCTNQDACNFDPNATIDDGSCFFCDDQDPCTIDTCDPATGGCIFTPIDCDDGDPCTVDECNPNTGGCINTPIDCDDGDLCTIDTCDPNSSTGCINTPIDCDDGDPCTVDECNPNTGGCINTPIDCDDGDLCTIDTCDPNSSTGCINTPVDCDDGDPCTVDECNPNTGGCINTPIDCDDGDLCTIDTCDPNSSTGCINTPIDCDDGDPCTVDECNPNTGGCVNTPNDCDDGDLCTIDECDPNSSTGCINTPIDCDDGNPCTLDECNPSTGGCTYTSIGGPVNDFASGALPNTPDRIWGVPGWDTFDVGCATLSAKACDGSAPTSDSWYRFVAQAENQGILVRANPGDPNAANVDMAVEIFDAALIPLAGLTGGECAQSRSCFNNAGAGQIERCVPGGLTIGNTYYYRIYDAAGAATGPMLLVDTKVKTYVDHPIISGCDFVGPGEWDIENPLNIYNIPPVPVFNVRMVITDGAGAVLSMTPPKDPQSVGGLNFTLAEFVPVLPPGVYTIHAQNEVKMHANGCVSAYWSQLSTGCEGFIGVPPTSQGLTDAMDSSNDLSFVAYPNPNNGDQVYLDLIDFEKADYEAVVAVIDMYGKLLHTEQFFKSSMDSKRTVTFEKSLGTGMYYISLTVKDRVITQKLVVQ